MNDTQLDFKFKTGNNNEYKVDGIRDSAVYAKESVGQLSGLYYLVSWKSYLEKQSTWEPALAIQHLWRLFTAYHKDNWEKPTAIFAPVNTAPLMVRPSALSRPTPTTDILIQQKRGQPAGPMAALTKNRGQPVRSTTTSKQAKKSSTSLLLDPFRFSSFASY